MKTTPTQAVLWALASMIVAVLALSLGEALKPHDSQVGQFVTGLLAMAVTGYVASAIVGQFMGAIRGPVKKEVLPTEK